MGDNANTLRVPTSPFDDSFSPGDGDPTTFDTRKPDAEHQDASTMTSNRFAGNPGAAKAKLIAAVKTIIHMNRSTSRFAQAFTVSLLQACSVLLVTFLFSKVSEV